MRACGAPLALVHRSEPVEIADDVEILEEIEPLDHLVFLQEPELAPDDRLVEAEGVRALRELEPAPHADDQEDAGETRREGQRHGAPPPRAPAASRLELLVQLGAIAGPVPRRRLSDRASEVAEPLSAMVGVLPTVRKRLTVALDATEPVRRVHCTSGGQR